MEEVKKRVLSPRRRKEFQPSKLITQGVVAYTAGLFDGEGCIIDHSTQGYDGYAIGCSMSQSESNRGGELFAWLRGEWEIGNIYHRKHRGKEWSPVFTWAIVAYSEVLYFLGRVEPFLFVKREKAEAALDFLRNAQEYQQVFYARECPYCGKPFQTDSHHQSRKYCSQSCASRHCRQLGGNYYVGPTRTLVCAWCGEPFKRKESVLKASPGKLAPCCCQSHAALYRVSVIGIHQSISTAVVGQCALCGASFEHKPSSNSGKNQFCCKEHWREYHRLRAASLRCSWCGIEFKRHPSMVKPESEYVFCCMEHYTEFRRVHWSKNSTATLPAAPAAPPLASSDSDNPQPSP